MQYWVELNLSMFKKMKERGKNMNKDNEEKEVRASKNRVDFEGNVANISAFFTNKNDTTSRRFDLAQNEKDGSSQFLPVILRGGLVDTYGEEIQKGDWLNIKGRLSTYTHERDVNGTKVNEKVFEIVAYEITDKNKNMTYKIDGEVLDNSKEDNSNTSEEQER